MLLDSVLSRGLSGLLMATFLLYADVVEREKKSLMSPLVRALIIHGPIPLCPNYFPETPPPRDPEIRAGTRAPA